jgi:hypothetical protein
LKKSLPTACTITWIVCRASSTTSAARLFNAYIFQSFNNLEDEIMVQQEEQQQQKPE